MIEVKICIGTYSYIMGGAELLNIESRFPVTWKGKVRLSGEISLEGCDESVMRPPFASVNNTLITEASEEKILKEIEKALTLDRDPFSTRTNC